MTPALPIRFGFTLLEVLIVLVLMGVASALVVPALRGAGTGAARPAVTVATRAQREAIRRAEALDLQVDDAGAWSLHVARTHELLDSGHVRLDSTVSSGTWVFDALGGCMPLANAVASAPFDALSCRAARASDETSGAGTP